MYHQWLALRALMGEPEWAAAVEYETAAGRVASAEVIDDRIAERKQLAIAAVRAFYAPLVANAVAPLVGAGWSITRFAACLALPTDRIDVFAAPEQPPKQGHFLLRR